MPYLLSFLQRRLVLALWLFYVVFMSSFCIAFLTAKWIVYRGYALIFKILISFYLKGRKERMNKNAPFIFQFAPQIPTTAGAGPNQSQEPGTHIWVSPVGYRHLVLEPCPGASTERLDCRKRWHRTGSQALRTGHRYPKRWLDLLHHSTCPRTAYLMQLAWGPPAGGPNSQVVWRNVQKFRYHEQLEEMGILAHQQLIEKIKALNMYICDKVSVIASIICMI